MSADVPIAFFSYSREDSEFALRLASDLRAAGSAVWIDQLDIGPGQLWDRAVQSALENCPSVLIILSPASVNSDNVMDEVSFALDQKKTLIPVLYRDCDIPFRIRRFQHIDFRTEYERMLQELKKCLHIGMAPQAPTAASADAAPSFSGPATDPTRSKPTVVEAHSQSEQARRFAAPVSQTPPASQPVQQFQPPQYVAAQQPPAPVYGGAKPAASKFPKWAKITIGIVAALMVVGVIANMNTNSDQQRMNEAQNNREVNSPPPGDYTAGGGAAGGGAENPGAPFELVGAALTRNETPPSCPPLGQSETSFSTNDTSVWFVFAYRNGSAEDRWTIDWVAPNDEIANTQVVKHPASGAATYCYFMRISGYQPSQMPGNWGVRLMRNGVELAQRPFRISR